MLFSWLNQRSIGLLLHPTALPGSQGVGNFGKSAFAFVDFLEATGFSQWQLCPLGPTGMGNSPYQSFSSFAGNPLLIDLELLVAGGLLKRSELSSLAGLPQSYVDFNQLKGLFATAFATASERFTREPHTIEGYCEFDGFVTEHSAWLKPYAAFSAFKKHFSGI